MCFEVFGGAFKDVQRDAFEGVQMCLKVFCKSILKSLWRCKKPGCLEGRRIGVLNVKK